MEISYADTIIKLSKTAKYLEIWLDKILFFAIYCNKVLAKMYGILAALQRIAGSI